MNNPYIFGGNFLKLNRFQLQNLAYFIMKEAVVAVAQNFSWSEFPMDRCEKFILIFGEKGHLRKDRNLTDNFIIVSSKFLRDQP